MGKAIEQLKSGLIVGYAGLDDERLLWDLRPQNGGANIAGRRRRKI